MNNIHSSRRDFLKTSAIIGATTTMGLSGHRPVHAAGSDMFKIGIIGCGGRGMGAVQNSFEAVPNTKLVAMGDVFADRAQNARKSILEAPQFKDRVDVPDSRLFTGFENYKGVIAESDVVLIACASRFHPFYTEEAVKAGKHVFVEKPHGVDAQGVQQTMSAAQMALKNKTALVSGLCYRYDTLRRQAVEQIRNGTIGDVVAIQSDYIRPPYSLRKREAGWSETEYQLRNWYHFTWLAGDEILQSLLHNLDSMLWILNEEAPKACYGIGGRSSMFIPEFGDTFDHTAVIYDYTGGREIYGMTRAANNCYISCKDLIHGTKGHCGFQGPNIPFITDLKGKVIWQPQEKRERSMYVQEHYEMIHSIMDHKPINDGERMAKTTMTAVLGFIASRTGQRLYLQELLDSKFSIGPCDVKDISFDTKSPVVPGANGVYPVVVPGEYKVI